MHHHLRLIRDGCVVKEHMSWPKWCMYWAMIAFGSACILVVVIYFAVMVAIFCALSPERD